MTEIKERNLQELENVTGGSVAEFGQLAEALFASPVIPKYLPMSSSNARIAANSEFVLYVKEQLEKNYAINADFYLGSEKCINTFTDQLTGRSLSFSDVLAKVQLG